VTVPRTDDDSWEITESVGATALGVAAARAAETARDNALISDPFAQVFLDAAGEGLWTRFVTGQSDGDTDFDREMRKRQLLMVDYMACRTAFFDDFFVAATEAGVRQAVIVAAGLDSRAWRLPWPDGTTVYEIDQGAVLHFKASTIEATDHHPTCARVEVPADLRHDWPTALRDAGFDAAAPSAWSTEGLLPYLPARAQDELFDHIEALSADGSRVAIEAMSVDFPNGAQFAKRREQMQRMREKAQKAGRDLDMPDVSELWYLEERADVAERFRRDGWAVTVDESRDLVRRYHRDVAPDVIDEMPQNRFITATRT
jgi:methyltransferase (TIGR00027 family)